MGNRIIKKTKRIIVTIFISLLLFFIFSNSVLAIEPVGPWTVNTSLPFDLASHPSTAYSDKLFVFGGATDFVRSETVSSSILPNGSLIGWGTSSSVPLPQSLFWHSLIQNGSYIYILGGAIYPNNTVNSVDSVYRSSFDSTGNIIEWKEMTPLPKRLAYGSVAIWQDKIYYSGGGTWTGGGSPEVNDKIFMSEVDPSGNLTSWETLPTTLPEPLLQHSLINTGQKLILIGGTNNSGNPSANVFSFDINPDGTLNNWTRLNSLIQPIRASMVNKTGSFVILAGGVTDSGVSDKVYYSILDNNGNLGDWVLSTNKLPRANHSAGSAVWNDYLYITGGHDGTRYLNSVWTSKIIYPTPTNIPTPTPPTPVVFLPGLGGSINFKEMFLGDSDPGGWRMTPGANVYKNLLKAFDFEENPNFHVFYYDWRKPVTENAQKLHDFIQNTIIPPENKIDLVGHSLGGLVARACVQKNTDRCFADKLITVGSPNSGAIDAYPALEGGEIWRTGPSKLGFELLLHYFQQPGETRRETLQRIAPVLKDLLPNFDYLEKNGANFPPSGLYFKNSLLPDLSDLSVLEDMTHTLSGRGFDTIEQIILTEPNWIDKLLGNWPDGKPAINVPTLEGDTSVLVKSSSFTNTLIKNFTYELDHGGIISQQVPLTKIMELLDLELKPDTYNPLTDEEDFLVFFVHSPVKISSLDITPDSYTTDELIIIPSPENKNYTLNVEGISNGYYLLSVGQILGEKVIWNDYFGETYSGGSQSFTFSVNPQSPSENPLLDPDGSSTRNQLNSRINEFRKEIRDLKIKPKDKKAILNLLNKIRKVTKNPVDAFRFLALLRQTIAGYEREEIISQEMANIFRNKSSSLGESIEFLAFLKPKQTSQSDAQAAIQAAENAKNSVYPGNLSKNGALVFIEAEEKLDKANLAFGKAEYYRAKIFAFEASSLFLESKLIK